MVSAATLLDLASPRLLQVQLLRKAFITPPCKLAAPPPFSVPFCSCVFLSTFHHLAQPIGISFLLLDFIYLFLERGGRRKKEREMLTCERNINWLSLTCPQLGTWPATQACALTGNQTDQASAQFTEPHQQGLQVFLYIAPPRMSASAGTWSVLATLACPAST